MDSDEVELPSHQRCASHIINLMATTDARAVLQGEGHAAYKKIQDSTTAKLREWWRKQNRSDLVAEAIKAGLGVKLEVPGETRWNSEFDAKLQVCSEEGTFYGLLLQFI